MRLRLLLVLAALSAAALGMLALTAGGAPSSHLSCGATIDHSVKLDESLVCPGDGLVVVADGVTIDLAGAGLTGDGGIADVGIRVAGHTGVRIKNGTVRSFGTGIAITSGSDKATVSGVSARANTYGIYVFDSDWAKISKSSAIRNALDGIVLAGTSEHGTVSWSDAVDNGAAGIVLHSSDLNSVVKSSATGNAAQGIHVDSGSDQNVISANLVAANGTRGIEVSSSGGDVVRTNTVSGNPQEGILVTTGGSHVLERNTVSGNGVGIGLAGSSATTVRRNGASGNAGDGIFVNGTAIDTVLEANEATGNGDDGIDSDSFLATLTKNVADLNGDYGLEALFAGDGGGNRARANGDPAQCSGPACA